MKKIKTQSIVLLVILLAGLLCLTGIATANNNSTSYDTGVALEIDHGNLIPILLTSNETISSPGNYTLTGDFTNKMITITASDVVLFLDNVNITNPSTSTGNTSPLQLMPGSSVTLVLVDGSENSFICQGTNTNDFNRQAGIFVNQTAELTIRGQTTGNPGNLTAIAGHYSAGIGGGPNDYPGKITIEGGNIVAESSSGSADGAKNGAGIGGGGGNSHPSRNLPNEIIIRGEANVTATSNGNGAGIGGGGNNANKAGENGIIRIYGNSNITATSIGTGAGIGGGGTSGHSGTNSTPAGSGGTIEIYDNANVTATSDGYGAGIGGGGSNNSTAGAGGAITIKDNATVTAKSWQNGAGIGGGGFNTPNGAGGAGGTIIIDGNPIIVANTGVVAGYDIGPGVRNAVSGTVGTITIDDGNVHAVKTSEVKNTNGAVLKMTKVTAGEVPGLLPNEHKIYDVYDSNGDYEYNATTNAGGEAYVWFPSINNLVAFDTDGGVPIPNPQSVENGDTAVLPLTEPVKTGNNFDEWQYSNNNTAYGNDPVTSNLILIAIYDPITYTVTFDSNGGSVVAPETVNHNAQATLPTAPIRAGYSFDDWYSDATLTTPYVFTDLVTTSITLYAGWTQTPTTGGGGGSGTGSATITNNTGGSNGSNGNASNGSASVRIEVVCIDENGNELYVQSLAAIVGNSEVITAPSIEGYMLVLNEKSSQEVTIVPGENVITFTYTKIPTDVQQPENNTRAFPWWIIIVILITVITIYLIARKQQNKNE
jgi:Listeria/Bacterioides repeat